MCLLNGLIQSRGDSERIGVLSGFIFGGSNLSNLRYADDRVLIADRESKLQEVLLKVLNESQRKG